MTSEQQILNTFFPESKWMFVTSLNIFPQGILEISHSQKWGVQPEYILPQATAVTSTEA